MKCNSCGKIEIGLGWPTPTVCPQCNSTKLDEATIQQMTWKQKVCAIVTLRILNMALKPNGEDEFFPDEIDISDILMADKNVIGTTFRNLRKQKIITKTGNFRASKAEGANGRTIFGYTLASRALANTLVVRLGGVRFDKQQQLPLN